MSAFLTVIVDSVRLLRARVIFWISLGISAVAALLYLSIGFDENGLTLLFGLFNIDMEFAKKGSPGAELIYLGIFRKAIVGFWLTWIAIIVALISVAPVFPEFMEEGSAGVTLSKPVSRPALFVYKFVGGLMFMLIQVSLFMLIVLVAIKLQLGFWNFSVLWAIPIVLLVFSYLHAVMVWLGIRTRSVMASVLLTLLFWLICFCAQFGEALTHHVVKTKTGLMGDRLSEGSLETWSTIHKAMRVPYTVLPKTSETTALLDRWIVLGAGNNLGSSELDAVGEASGLAGDEIDTAKQELERHSPTFIIGTSLLFELAVLGFAMRSFCRRDF